MGLFRRRDAHFAELTAIPAIDDLPTARLQAPARYLGTVTEDGEKVIGQSLSVKSASRLHLSAEALDVVRMAGSFRIPVTAMRGATSSGDFGGQPVESLLVVRWEHGEHQWRTGFRLEATRKSRLDKTRKAAPAPDPGDWVRTISKMSRKSAGGR